MSDPESWSPCPSGEFSRLQESLRQQGTKLRARRKFLIAGGAALVASGGMVTLAVLQLPAPISCQEVHDLKTAYLDGRLQSPSKRRSIETHLALCRRCKEFYDAKA